eukprot:g11394.t1
MAEEEAAKMAGEIFEEAGMGMGDEAAGEGTSFESVFESVKTSLPGLDMFDPSVFDIRMVMGVLVCVAVLAYAVFRLFVRKVVGEDDFFADLGISYKDFDMPDEVDDYYDAKEDPEIAKDTGKLRNALLKRAIADIPIILRMQNEGPGIYNMYQQAMIGEKEWHAFQQAETMISEEIESVQNEADEIEPGWSQSIWPLAMQLRTVLVQRREQAEAAAEKKADEEAAAKEAAAKGAGKGKEKLTVAKKPAAAAAAGKGADVDEVSFFTYVREVILETTTTLQEIPLAVASEVAGLVQDVPIVSIVCKTFLAFEALVDTAKSNKEDLTTLLELCGVVIEGLLDKRSDRTGLFKGFTALENHVNKAKEVAHLCNGRVRMLILSRKVCREIMAVRNDILAFCTTTNLVFSHDTNAKMDKFGADLIGKLEAMKMPTVTQADHREEQSRVTDLASNVKVPPEAPSIRDWYIEREAVVGKACDRLGIGSSVDPSEEPRMVGLAGPSGAGKSTVASMVIAREDVRASFHKGVLWLQVGQGAQDRLPELMTRLADMVYETVMCKGCRPPQRMGLESTPEDGAAYIREVVDESNRRFLVVADDVREVEVLRELKRIGVWVLYTTRHKRLLPEAPLRLDQVLTEEAEMVLRRAADLNDDARLPEAAYGLMERSEFVVMDLTLVGRWGVVRGRNDGKAWQTVLSRIVEAQQEGEGGQPLSWRAAMLRAGLEELACDNPQNKELYLSLAVIPKGLAFPSEVAAVLLYSDDLSTGDVVSAKGVAATLERWSILTLEGGGKYRVHEEHADFIQGHFAANHDVRNRALVRWRGYISSTRALLTFSSGWLVKIWDDALARFGDTYVVSRPFDTALGAMDPSNAELSRALERAARFHCRRKDWLGAHDKNSQLLEVVENTAGGQGSLEAAGILHSLGACMYNADERERAGTFYRQALAIREKELGDDHLDVARTLYSLGVCVYALGQTEEAEAFHLRALAVRKQRLGADHLDVAKVLHSVGVCVDSAGRTDEAEDFYRKALAIREEKLEAGHPDLSSSLHRLGRCACAKGRTEEGVDLFRRAHVCKKKFSKEKLRAQGWTGNRTKASASLYSLGPCPSDILGSANKAFDAVDMEEFYGLALSIQEEKLGADHPVVATTLNTLGKCAYDAGRVEEAEKLHRRALTIRGKKLGVDHPDVAATLHNLGRCAYTAGRNEEAERRHRRALTIQEKNLGVDHLDVAFTLYCLGLCAHSAGRTEETEKLWRRALDIQEEKLGADHLDITATLHNLGLCAYEAGRMGEAEKCFGRVLTVQEEKLSVDHPDVALTLYCLGLCTFKAGRTLEAEAFHRRALTIREEKLGVDHPVVATILHNLGKCAFNAGRTHEAEEFYQRALDIQEEQLGVDHPCVANILHSLGVHASQAGRTEEAEAFYRRALTIREEQLGVGHPCVANILYSLGVHASQAGRTEEAEAFYRRALIIWEKKPGLYHPDVPTTLNKLRVHASQAGTMAETE